MRLKSLLNEISQHNLSILSAVGASHDVKRYRTPDGKTYYVKFSGQLHGDIVDANMHMIIELMAYRIYSLYNVSIPEDVFLVLDKDSNRIGLASQDVDATYNLMDVIDDVPDASDIFLPSVLLSNWDVAGNTLVNADNKYFVIDPGGALSFRARGKRKKYTDEPIELSTMRNKDHKVWPSEPTPAGMTFKYITDEMLKGPLLDKFVAVPVSAIIKQINSVEKEAVEKIDKIQDKSLASQLLSQLKIDCTVLKTTIAKRYKNMLKAIKEL